MSLQEKKDVNEFDIDWNKFRQHLYSDEHFKFLLKGTILYALRIQNIAHGDGSSDALLLRESYKDIFKGDIEPFKLMDLPLDTEAIVTEVINRLGRQFFE
jgi:hypothetical protein